MSHIFHLSSRNRSASTSRQVLKHQMPEELPTRSIRVPPNKPTGIKIEDKLINYQIQAKKRLELLKMNLEQEKLKDLQDKPKILKKSKILAEIHDKKLLGDRNSAKEMPKIENFCVNQPENTEKPESPCKIVVESVPFSGSEAIPDKKRAKSLSNFSFAEKKKELTEHCAENERYAEGVREKTLTVPEEKVENKVKGLKKLETDHKFPKEDVLTPQSVETYADSVEHQIKPNKKGPYMARNLAPFQVRVSFECGLDLDRFIKRAK